MANSPVPAKKTLVTSALIYANGQIHLGHLVEYIQTDIYVRFRRLLGDDIIYCCADDTHGTPIMVNARTRGITPEQLIAESYKDHIREFTAFRITFDTFHSTHSDEARKWTDYIYTKNKEAGNIIEEEIEQLFDTKENIFLPDRFVKGICPKCGAEDQYGDSCESCSAAYKPTELKDPRSVISGTKPILKKTRHLFFKLDAVRDQLIAWLRNARLQEEVVNYINNWIEEGLRNWDFTRDAPYFGFPVPGTTDKYYYVWWDAPVGYFGSCDKWCSEHTAAVEEYIMPSKNELIHFIGRDIIYHHFIYWPAMLIGAGMHLPDAIHVHGFLTVGKQKMSKSRGTFIQASQYLQKFDPLYLRYYYAANLSGKMIDIDLDFNDFKNRINSELIGTIANFCNRTLTFIKKNFNGQINAVDADGPHAVLREAFDTVKQQFLAINLRAAVRTILDIATAGNKYFQNNEPWKIIKENPTHAEAVLGSCLHLVRDIIIPLKAIIPSVAEIIEQQLQVDPLTWDDLGNDLRGHTIGVPSPPIKKLEDFDLYEHDPFASIDLRAAKVVQCEAHPNADKLLVLQIDVGILGQRQLVAGLAAFYTPEELVGQTICIVANLKPVQLRGQKSQGMLLAASNADGQTALVSVQAEPGTPITAAGIEPAPLEQITIDDFFACPITARADGVYYNNHALRAGTKPVVPTNNIVGKVK